MAVLSCGAGGCSLLLSGSTEDRSTALPVSYPGIEALCLGGTLAIGARAGSLVAWGENSPVPRPLGLQATAVACGWTHALVLCQGEVFALGEGRQGQLGLAQVTAVAEPTVIPGTQRATGVACGFRTSFVISAGRVYCFGDNKKWQLGLETPTCIATPVLHHSLCGVKQVASGHRHSLAIADSALFVWGNNDFGQLGLDCDRSLPTEARLPESPVEVACGWFHSAVLCADGGLYVCGKGDMGVQGRGDWRHCRQFSKVLGAVTSFASGSEHLLAVSGATVYSWGWNEHGDLGLGDCANRCRPEPLPLTAVGRVLASSAVSFFL